MLNCTQAFLDPLEGWVRAIRQDDFKAARQFARQLIDDGELLANNPDFQKCFAAHCGGFDPHSALFHMCQFLLCTTSGRAVVLRNFVNEQQERPPPPSPPSPDG